MNGNKASLIRLVCRIRRCWNYAMYYIGVRGNRGVAKKLFKDNFDLLKDCKKAFFQLATTRCELENFVECYKRKAIKTHKLQNIALNENEPIFLCVVKDDLIRVKAQLEWYRKIGVRHFAYIDNMSTDGTFEYLEKQDDVSLFSIDEEYHTNRQHAWTRQATDILGYEKWYFLLDSDEFFAYPGMEKNPITRYIDFLEKKNINCVFALMLDMYSKDGLFKSSMSNDDFMKEYCYFDTDSYKITVRATRMGISGGPRIRLFNGTCQVKYPLVKLSKSIIHDSHSKCPFELNFQTLAPIAFLLHYKFLPADISKFEDHVKSEVHYGGSKEYKLYMDVYKKNPGATFLYDGSAKFNNSMDLLKINIGDNKFFDEFLKKEE